MHSIASAGGARPTTATAIGPVHARRLRNSRAARRPHMRVPRRALYAAALSLSATTPGLLPGWRIPPAHAVVELSDEQQLVVDAWAVVQRAYVDPGFNGVDWKAVRTDYVKRPYKGMKAARKGKPPCR